MKHERRRLDRLKQTLETSGQRAKDPVSLVHACRSRRDREIAGFLVSSLAYGRREIILRNGRDLLSRLGPFPARMLLSSRPPDFLVLFRGFKHRLNTASDLALLCGGLRRVLKAHGSLEALFAECVAKTDWLSGLRRFVCVIRKAVEEEAEKKGLPLGRVGHLLPLPDPGAAKRLNLFLKWMIRKDAMDPGVWSVRLGQRCRDLVIPLDVHIAAMARRRGLVRSRNANWASALRVTDYLRRICPEDPLRYDFCLCHSGMESYRRNGRKE